MVLSKKYNSQSNILASYDYIDIASGTGNEIFYLTKTEDSSGVDNVLTAEQLYSTSIETYDLIINTSNTFAEDLDYDLSAFNTPKIVDGTAIVQLGGSLFCETAGDVAWVYYTVNLYKVSGGVETLIGTNTGPTEENRAGGTIVQYIHVFPITCTETPFKIGDTLRANVKLHISGAGSGNAGASYMGHDPVGRDGIYVSGSSSITNSQIIVPFRIDV